MTLAKRSLTGERVGRLPASGIRRFFDLAAGIPGVISLGVGEPDFVTPDGFPSKYYFDGVPFDAACGVAQDRLDPRPVTVIRGGEWHGTAVEQSNPLAPAGLAGRRA